MLLDIKTMTTEQKLGMLYCARSFSEEDIEFILELIGKRALGSIQLPPGNQELIDKIKAAADYPIIIVGDAEVGFPTTNLPKIGMNSLAACDNKEYTRAFAKGIIRDGKKAGFNAMWGPVVDITRVNGANRLSRIASDDPKKVSEIAEEIAKVFKENNYISGAKHYPGGEDYYQDTHMEEGTSNVTEKELLEFDLIPYLHLMERGLLPVIMSAHCVFNNIDPEYPATLSKKVMSIIRDKGFDGVIFTDSLAMMGILQKYGEKNVYGMAIAAGNDIILPNYRTPAREAFEYLVKSYEDGVFSEDRLNEAAQRVIKAQEYISREPLNPTEFTKEDEAMLYAIARDCITAVTDDGVSAALGGEDKDKLFVILRRIGSQTTISEEIVENEWYFPTKIADKIKQEFPGSGIEFLPEFSGPAENERVLNAATRYKEVIIITFCESPCYTGTDGLTRRTEAVINALANSGKASTVVHFGNPYALEEISHIKRKIFGYKITESQIYAIDVLKGNIEAKGKLPFNIKFR